MQFGEYTLAVWDTQVGIPGHTETPTDALNIYPNPSNDIFYLQYKITGSGEISIFSSSGTPVKDFDVKDEGILEWEPGSLPAGNYIVTIQSDNNNITDSTQIVYIH
jgi:hypothetical protein